MASSLDFAVAQVLLPRVVGRVGTVEDAQKASTARAAKYEAAARMKLPLLQRVDPLGSLSLRQIAARLNAMEVPTVSGKGSWSANSVKRLKAISP